MTRPLLPPRGIFTGTSWLFDPDLAAGIKETLLQLMALTWGNDAHSTMPLTYPQLEFITHKNTRTLRGHLLALRNYHAALCLQPAGAGRFIVALTGWVFNNNIPYQDARPIEALEKNGKFLPGPVKEDQNQLTQEDEEKFLHLLNIPDQPGGAANGEIALENGDFEPEIRPALLKLGMRLAAPDPQPQTNPHIPTKNLPPARAIGRPLRRRLTEAGVFLGLLSEVETLAAKFDFTDKDLDALLAWCVDEQPERPAALFIGRLRCGALAPARFRKPACRRCGKHGRHADDCPLRYTYGAS